MLSFQIQKERYVKQYSNNEYNFSLSIPDDWEIVFENQVDNPPWTQPVRLAGPKRAVMRPYITIVAAIVQDSTTELSDYMQKAESDLRPAFSDFKLISKEEKYLLDWPSAWMTYTYQGENNQVQELNVTIFFGKGRLFWFQFICEADKSEAETVFRIFHNIINSLKVGSAGLRHPNVILSGASRCLRCGRSFNSSDSVNAMIDIDTGRLLAVCETCRRK